MTPGERAALLAELEALAERCGAQDDAAMRQIGGILFLICAVSASGDLDALVAVCRTFAEPYHARTKAMLAARKRLT